MDAPFPLTAARATAAEGPLGEYRARVAAGTLRADPAQARAAEALHELWWKLRGYDPHPAAPGRAGIIGRLFRRGGEAKGDMEAPPGTPHGLYLVGEVGRGKSMLMDLFFAEADVPRRRRLHFHAFMQGVHQRIHQWRALHPGEADPIPPLADTLAEEAALLCFDEFQVADIADAILLGRLFEALFVRGVVVVATSNTLPDDLFKGRPGRDAFLPFIGALKRNLDVLVLEAERDYRRDRNSALRTWHCPIDGAAERAMDAAFLELAGVPHGAPTRLAVLGRTLAVPELANRVARADFEALCGAPLGPPDFLALATHVEALVLDAIPRLGPENFDRARRFITLVDALYEHRCKLFASAAASPDALYERGENAAMFGRTASRLIEMGSREYLALPHLT